MLHRIYFLPCSLKYILWSIYLRVPNVTYIMIDPQTLEQLETIDERSWAAIYKQLLLYATFKLNKAGFEIRTEKDSVDAEHFVADAIEKLFDGTRKWDFRRLPDVAIHLKLIIKSLISNHFKSSKRSIVNAGKEYDKLTWAVILTIL